MVTTMDLTLVAYTISVFAALLAVTTYSHWGVAEVHTYTIPPYLDERGYNELIVSNQVVDAMHRIRIEVTSLTEATVVVQGQAEPIGDVASYFGVIDLLKAAEGLFGLNPRLIALEITQNEDNAHWRFRGDHVVHGFLIRQGDVSLKDLDALIDFLGLQVIEYVSPFEALAFHFIQDSENNDYDATIQAASALLLDCKKLNAWVCTATNLNSAYLLRGMAHLYSGHVQRAFDDFATAKKIGGESALDLAFYADAFAALGDVDSAKAQYLRAKALNPKIGEQFLAVAEGYAQAGNHRLAERRYTTAAELGLLSEALMLGWGDSLFALGSYDTALKKYELAQAADPNPGFYNDRIDRTRKAIDENNVSVSKTPEAIDSPGTSDTIIPVQPAEPSPIK
jgi:tetratricopeptide (TPR) repeat protein